jgi:hypothetical protein
MDVVEDTGCHEAHVVGVLYALACEARAHADGKSCTEVLLDDMPAEDLDFCFGSGFADSLEKAQLIRNTPEGVVVLRPNGLFDWEAPDGR